MSRLPPPGMRHVVMTRRVAKSMTVRLPLPGGGPPIREMTYPSSCAPCLMPSASERLLSFSLLSSTSVSLYSAASPLPPITATNATIRAALNAFRIFLSLQFSWVVTLGLAALFSSPVLSRAHQLRFASRTPFAAKPGRRRTPCPRASALPRRALALSRLKPDPTREAPAGDQRPINDFEGQATQPLPRGPTHDASTIPGVK